MKNIIGVLIGNTIEYYCLTLYGFLAILLAPIFFPNDDPNISLLISFGVFSLGFVMRPIGALFFGHLGDRMGRKKSLLISVFLVTIPTFLIGLTPTYFEIGILAPLLITFFRLIQGFCSGGESTISAIFLNEHTTSTNEGFMGSVLCASSLIGALIGMLFCSLCTLDFMPDFGWRLPFLFSIFPGIIGFFLRKNLEETPSFKAVQQENKVLKIPLLELIKNNYELLLCGIGISATSLIPFYVSSVYLNKIILDQLNFSQAKTLIFNACFMVLWVVLFPIAGRISDKVQKLNLMALSASLTIVASLPLLYLLSDVTILKFICAQSILIFVGVTFVAPLNAVMPKVFPENKRCSGFSMSFSLGASLFGGTTPFIISYLNQYTAYATQLYLAFGGLLGTISLLYIINKQKVSHEHPAFEANG